MEEKHRSVYATSAFPFQVSPHRSCYVRQAPDLPEATIRWIYRDFIASIEKTNLQSFSYHLEETSMAREKREIKWKGGLLGINVTKIFL